MSRATPNLPAPAPSVGSAAPRPPGVAERWGAWWSRAAYTGFVYALLSAGALLMLFPLWWMVIVSLETPAEAQQAAAAAAGFELVPDEPQFSNYPEALAQMGTERWMGFINAAANTIVVTTLSVIGQVLSCSLVGYAFARLRFRGRDPMFLFMLATMMLPPQVTMIPMFILFRSLGLIDTIWPLVLPTFFGQPFYIFLFRQFFAQVPESLVEAGRLDGCTHLGIWWRIMLPICKPVIAITAIFTFMFVWNDFLGPLIYLNSEEKYTLAIALNAFRNQFGGVSDVHLLMAASIVTMIPCVVLFFIGQKQLVGGLGAGAVKG
jgi:ABC-type glycerol-3-phosphate transport system permease component